MHRPRLYFLCAALVLVGFAPCCGGTKPGGPGADAGEGDTLFGRDALPDLVPEDSMPGDHRGEGPVDWVLPEGLGEVPPGELAPDGWAIVPCTEHTDCPEGFCVENPPGSGTSICAPLCEGGCPPGWECASVSISGPDPVDVCLPPQDMLCRSCKTDGDCLYAGALCILGGQPKGFCGRACVEGGEACPEGFGCQLVADAQGQPLAWQCLPVPGSCCAGGKWVDCDDKNPCTADKCVPGTGCTHDPVDGPCDGPAPCTEYQCVAGECVGWPKSEDMTFDGVDDDCDGEIDEDVTQGLKAPAWTFGGGLGVSEGGGYRVVGRLNTPPFHGVSKGGVFSLAPDVPWGFEP